MLTEIFKKPEILNKETHKDLKISPYNDYSFSKDAYIVPISLDEVLVAMKSLLVVFIKENETTFTPVVILGTKETKNLQLDNENNWKKEKYIPATIRSYPFGLGVAKDGKEKFITIDSESDVFKGEKGFKLFEEELNFSKNGQQSIGFVQKVYANIENSKDFTSHINSLGLFKNAILTIEKDEEKFELSNIFVIDENELNKLESRKLKKLATAGYMKYIYAHIISMNNKY